MELFPYVELKNLVTQKEDKSAKGAANGYAPLDSGAKIPWAQLPTSITQLATTAESKTNKGAANGYPSLDNNKRIPLTQLPESVASIPSTLDWVVSDGLPYLQSLLDSKADTTEAVPEGGADGQVLTKASAADNDVEWAYPPALDYATAEEIEAGESITKVVTPFGFERQIIKVREREEGREYKTDSLILYADKLWRANKETTGTPGPEAVYASAMDSDFWTRSGSIIEDSESGSITLNTPLAGPGGIVSPRMPFSMLDGFVVEVDASWTPGGTNRGYQKFGLMKHDASTGWSQQNTVGLTGNNFPGTSSGWKRLRVEFSLVGTDIVTHAYVDDVLAIEVVEPNPLSDDFRLRIQSATVASQMSFRGDFVFPHGELNPDWDEVVEIGATKRYSKLSGIPTTFSPSSHNHDASNINAGTLAAARLPSATETAIGAVERATNAEVTAGTDTTRYVSPAGLKNVLDTRLAEVAGSTDLRAVNRASNGTWPARPAGAVNVLWIDLTSNAPSDPVDLDPAFDVILDPGVV